MSAARAARASYVIGVRRAWALLLFAWLWPTPARADGGAALAPEDPVARVAFELGLFALSGASALAGFSKRPPLSLVVVAWPTTARQEDDSARDRPATWTMPAGGRRPMFYATLVDLRF